MNFTSSTFFSLFPVSSSTQSFCHCHLPSTLFRASPPWFQSSSVSEIPFVCTPSPVPSNIPSSPTSSSSNSEHRPSSSLPTRSASFDLSALIVKARWRREQFGEYLECAFCKANGEAYDIYSSHRLRDNDKLITLCPILRAHTCPRCQASGDRAHTMKYCPVKAEMKATRRMHEIELAMRKK